MPHQCRGLRSPNLLRLPGEAEPVQHQRGEKVGRPGAGPGRPQRGLQGCRGFLGSREVLQLLRDRGVQQVSKDLRAQ